MTTLIHILDFVDDTSDWVRLYTLCLSFVLYVWWIFRFRVLLRASRSSQLFRIAACGLLISTDWRTWNSLVGAPPPGWSAYITACAVTMLAIAAYWELHDGCPQRPPYRYRKHHRRK